MQTLPDLLAPGLDLVFVGINPSVYAAQHGHYFARPSNRFWPLLSRSGLVPAAVGPTDDRRLLELGIGLTDIVKRPTVSAAEVTREEFRLGRDQLRQKLLACAPRAACAHSRVSLPRH